MILAAPAGWLADRCRRDSVLRGAALVGLLAAIVFGFVLVTDASILWLSVAMGLVGGYRLAEQKREAAGVDQSMEGNSVLRSGDRLSECYCNRGFNNPPLESIFADSVQTGQR